MALQRAFYLSKEFKSKPLINTSRPSLSGPINCILDKKTLDRKVTFARLPSTDEKVKHKRPFNPKVRGINLSFAEVNLLLPMIC